MNQQAVGLTRIKKIFTKECVSLKTHPLISSLDSCGLVPRLIQDFCSAAALSKVQTMIGIAYGDVIQKHSSNNSNL